MAEAGGSGRSAVSPRESRKLSLQQLTLLRIAEGMFDSNVLFATTQLGVFDALAGGPRSAADLSSALDVDPDGLERLLTAAATLGLLERHGEMFANAELVATTLVTGQPGYLGNWIRLQGRRSAAWARLADSVRTGEPVEDPGLHLGADPGYTADFIGGMHDYARLRGSEIVKYLDLSGGLRVLDVGGGPGTYSILFAQTWPDLAAVVFDLPAVVPIAEANAAEAGVAERVSVQPGNYLEDELGDSEFDAAFLSDALHQESPDSGRMILRKVHRALKPGGRAIIQAMFLDEDGMGPRWPVIMSLNLLLIHGEGRSYSASETIDLLEETGFTDCRHETMSLTNVNSFIEATRVT